MYWKKTKELESRLLYIAQQRGKELKSDKVWGVKCGTFRDGECTRTSRKTK